jgi:hypothetical protein
VSVLLVLLLAQIVLASPEAQDVPDEDLSAVRQYYATYGKFYGFGSGYGSSKGPGSLGNYGK